MASTVGISLQIKNWVKYEDIIIFHCNTDDRKKWKSWRPNLSFKLYQNAIFYNRKLENIDPMINEFIDIRSLSKIKQILHLFVSRRMHLRWFKIRTIFLMNLIRPIKLDALLHCFGSVIVVSNSRNDLWVSDFHHISNRSFLVYKLK